MVNFRHSSDEKMQQSPCKQLFTPRRMAALQLMREFRELQSDPQRRQQRLCAQRSSATNVHKIQYSCGLVLNSVSYKATYSYGQIKFCKNNKFCTKKIDSFRNKYILPKNTVVNKLINCTKYVHKKNLHSLGVMLVLFLLIVPSKLAVANPQVKFPVDFYTGNSAVSNGRSLYGDRTHRPRFTESDKEHDTFIVEPFVSSGVPSLYAPITSSQYHQTHRPTQVNRFQHSDPSQKPYWSSSPENHDRWSQKTTRPSTATSNHYRQSDLPPELAALTDEELDSFFVALYRNRTRYARRPNEDFGEGIGFAKLKYNYKQVTLFLPHNPELDCNYQNN